MVGVQTLTILKVGGRPARNFRGGSPRSFGDAFAGHVHRSGRQLAPLAPDFALEPEQALYMMA